MTATMSPVPIKKEKYLI